jgi:urease gamma subunit
MITNYSIQDMHNLANKYGGKCLSAKYINANTKLKWRCNKGHVWKSTPSSVKQGHWCLECSGSKKKSIYDMQNLAKMRGGKCLSKEYVNNKTKLKWQCNEGHVWEAVPSSVAKRTWCPICGKKKSHESNKLTIEEMQLIAQNRKGKCLSKKYIDNRTKLEWQCKQGHIWEATPNHVKNGTWCPVCIGKNQDIRDMHKLAERRGGKCLSSKYTNNRTKLTWQCGKGHTWEATPHNIRNHWCPECGGSKKLTLKDIHKLAETRGGKCLSPVYKNARYKLKWQCSEGHIWEAVPDSIKQGSWCPECSIGLGERICRVIFQQLFNYPFPKARPKWLVNEYGNQMELDGFCRPLNLAFEYQGIQHYERVEFFQTKTQFKKRIEDDKRKQVLCEEHEIVLILVPEIGRYININDLKKFIIEECKKANYPKLPDNIESKNIDLIEAYTPDYREHLNILNTIARNNEGTCLSKIYLGNNIKLTFKCKNDHIWEAVPSSIKQGVWCPICANKNRGEARKLTIEEMQSIAQKRKGKCLSKKYIDSKSKLKWQCEDGHVWNAIVGTVMRGAWCPECAGNKKLDMSSMNSIANERGGKCLSSKYINARTKLKWQCEKGHIWKATPDNIKHGSWCPVCVGKYQDIRDMHKLANEKGGKCLSSKYTNNRTKLEWQCKQGHIWEATPNNVKNGTWCPQCSGNKKLSIKDMERIAESRGGKCLSTKYINANTRLSWQCEKGHLWDAIPNSIKRGSWCPICRNTKM